MDFLELKKGIKNLCTDFMKDMEIDPTTGLLKNTHLRFSGFPYIGANYVNAPIKILFIPLDCGIDELSKQNTYHSFESRENIFKEGNLTFNDHIAGIYATTLLIIKDRMQLQEAWERLQSQNGYTVKKAITNVADSLPRNLMTYVAYENRFRFVTKDRDARTGGKDRLYINPQRERQLLMDEVKVFNPDVIVFQGKEGLWNCGVDVLKKKYNVIEAMHPSAWQYKANKLQYIVEHIAPQISVK